MDAHIVAMFQWPAAPRGCLVSSCFGDPGFEHCELYFPDTDETLSSVQGMAVVMYQNVRESQRYSTVRHFTKGEKARWFALPLTHLNAKEAEKVRAAAYAMVGRPYNYGSLFTFIFPCIHFPYPIGGYFCSEATAHVFIMTGHLTDDKTSRARLKPHKTHPSHFFQAIKHLAGVNDDTSMIELEAVSEKYLESQFLFNSTPQRITSSSTPPRFIATPMGSIVKKEKCYKRKVGGQT